MRHMKCKITARAVTAKKQLLGDVLLPEVFINVKDVSPRYGKRELGWLPIINTKHWYLGTRSNLSQEAAMRTGGEKSEGSSVHPEEEAASFFRSL
mmetsp:Transcript_122635/g.211966  ORF Transcript_122635/g.211966 Transcript_122635/m.211966 type:complete len:95 (+) Transcript_122635:35-319(+)